MSNKTNYLDALNSEVFRTISSNPETSFQYVEIERTKKAKFLCKWLLPGEEIKIEELNVGFITFYGKIYGKVFVTNYRLRFEENNNRNNKKNLIFEITLGCISKVEKVGFSNVSRGEDSYGIEIICKDMRNVRFLHRPQTHSRRPLFDCLQKFAFPYSNKLPFFAILYAEKFKINGWNLFFTEKEFKRQNVSKRIWTLTKINNNYNFSATYPSMFAVPTEIIMQNNADEILRLVAEFRSKQRIPVLSWINSKTSAAIIRSSQPLVGVSGRKSVQDEDYVDCIINANPNSKNLIILDARPSVNAKANRAKGGGYEEYERCKLKFLDIPNIHAVRDSFKRIKDACFPRIDHKNFYKALDETKWLDHIQLILDGASRLVLEISNNLNSVLVHCSDGWDRTAQLTSLAMLQLDPYYRTIEGFAVLIEKEWCSFGHKFAHRIGHGEYKHSDPERSPIFVQFIDCVWQLFNQFTSSFEFNVKFLKTILDELYSCRFGTFLYNSEKERTELEVKKNTISLWSYILDNRKQYQNPSYNPNTNILDFLNSPLCTKLWTEYYCRYNHEVILPEQDFDKIDEINKLINNNFIDSDASLKERTNQLRNNFISNISQLL